MIQPVAKDKSEALVTFVQVARRANVHSRNILAALPILDALVEALIEKGLLVPPENGIGAEGCWMSVAK